MIRKVARVAHWCCVGLGVRLSSSERFRLPGVNVGAYKRDQPMLCICFETHVDGWLIYELLLLNDEVGMEKVEESGHGGDFQSKSGNFEQRKISLQNKT